MLTYTVVVFDREERSAIAAVVPSLTIAYPTDAPEGQNHDAPEPRAVRALAAKTDATHELLTRARDALRRQADICEREASLDYWTHHLSLTDDPITPDTPGGGLVANPYVACQVLAEARQVQHREACEALAVVNDALRCTTPRPANPKYVDA